jgi:prepilin-type N-terminal cleavage/methylation domain-containing protein
VKTLRLKGFTLVEIVIVLLIIGMLIGIAVPQFIRSREKARANTCIANLRQMSHSKDQFAMTNSLPEGTLVNPQDIWPMYLKTSQFPVCPAGGSYTIGVTGTEPTCTKQVNSIPHILP